MLQSRIKVRENAPICHKKDVYGIYDSGARTMTICTDRIFADGEAQYYINETILHESTHVAQSCRIGMTTVGSFGLAKVRTPLSQRRELDLGKSAKISGPNSYFIEREAFWMEDKPNMVKYVVQKYCL